MPSSYNTIDGAFAFGNMVWCHVAKLCNQGLIRLTYSPALLRTTHSHFLLRTRPWGVSKNTALWRAHIASVVLCSISIRPFVWSCSFSPSWPLLKKEYSEVCRLTNVMEWISHLLCVPMLLGSNSRNLILLGGWPIFGIIARRVRRSWSIRG
jgi:hypothetical protein